MLLFGRTFHQDHKNRQKLKCLSTEMIWGFEILRDKPREHGLPGEGYVSQ